MITQVSGDGENLIDMCTLPESKQEFKINVLLFKINTQTFVSCNFLTVILTQLFCYNLGVVYAEPFLTAKRNSRRDKCTEMFIQRRFQRNAKTSQAF